MSQIFLHDIYRLCSWEIVPSGGVDAKLTMCPYYVIHCFIDFLLPTENQTEICNTHYSINLHN